MTTIEKIFSLLAAITLVFLVYTLYSSMDGKPRVKEFTLTDGTPCVSTRTGLSCGWAK